VEDRLARIEGWLNRGNLGQFCTEVEAKLANTDYVVEQEDGILRFYHVEKKGGFFGIGAKKDKHLVLEVKSEGGTSHVVEQDADQDFVGVLLKLLEQH